MALFQKKPIVSDSLPLYSLGANKTVLLIGLGNPEAKYNETRHNIGFATLNFFAESNDFPDWVSKKDLKCHMSVKTLGHTRVILCKPTTYMNNSGEAAVAIQHFYRVYNSSALAIYDELAVKFGQLRTRVGGSDAGHNGVGSLIQHIGDDFNRLRIGIGSETSDKAEPTNFVLGKFTKQEQENLTLIYREANEFINEFIFSGKLIPQTRNVLG
ncbi:aminoacyl-tRNA hydrolase [Candidatus Saccharibacteria bacterium]|nr:aminoacyl-tRNA hydrolase [Candidatus Saccharibacteria bacterium]